jgi:hypothetical protein
MGEDTVEAVSPMGVVRARKLASRGATATASKACA